MIAIDDPVHYRAIGGTVYDAVVTRVHPNNMVDLVVCLPGVAQAVELTFIPFSTMPSNTWRTAYRKETLF